MKSTLLAGITAVMITLSTAVFADKAHHKDKDEAAGKAMSGMMHSESGMPMMDMDGMHKQMAAMQKTMDTIRGTKDPKKRQELMQQHMQEMHKGMGMMQGMMSGKMTGKMKEPMEMMDEDDEMADLKTMKKRHKMMEQRMDTMQEMMGQMMEHKMQQQQMGMEKR